MQRLRLKADGRIVELRDGQEFPLAPAMPVAPADGGNGAPAAVRDLRRRARLTQIEFAARLGVPVETIRNWEQGKRMPRGPARALLAVIAHAPETVFAALALVGNRRAGLARRTLCSDIMGAISLSNCAMQFVEANGAKIPAIGLGTWELRGRTCARLVEQALRLGYRHIDTAQVYENEREVGEGLRASGVRRDEVFVTTKVWTTHFAPNDLERSTKESLTKLRLSEVDLLLLHWPNPQVPLSETLGALAHVKQARHGQAYRRLEFHRGLDRGGGRGMPGAAGVRSGRIPSLSRPDQGAGRLRAPRHGGRRLQPDRQGPHQGRRDAGADRAGPRQDRRAGLPALAGAAERRRDTADLEDRAAVGKYRRSSTSSCPTTRCGRYPAWASARGPADRFRFRAEMGLRLPRAARLFWAAGASRQHSITQGGTRTGHTHGHRGVGDRASVGSGAGADLRRGASVRFGDGRADRGRYRDAAGGQAEKKTRSRRRSRREPKPDLPPAQKAFRQTPSAASSRAGSARLRRQPPPGPQQQAARRRRARRRATASASSRRSASRQSTLASSAPGLHSAAARSVRSSTT